MLSETALSAKRVPKPREVDQINVEIGVKIKRLAANRAWPAANTSQAR